MNPRKKSIVSLISLIILLFIINYSFLDNAVENFFSEGETAIVARVIDGDTVSLGNISVRFLGINTPEKGEKYYAEAKEFTQSQILNKTIELEYGKSKFDLYHRILAYVVFNGRNINKELIENGFANYYFPSGKDKHYAEFKTAWENCIKKEINLCEKSQSECASCIKLKNFDYKNQIVIFENICDFDCDLTNWKIKDEGRKNFIFPKLILQEGEDIRIIVGNEENTEADLFWKNEEYVWTKSGDTLFLRDEEGKLVLWEGY
jgi:micrococcal nuclease